MAYTGQTILSVLSDESYRVEQMNQNNHKLLLYFEYCITMLRTNMSFERKLIEKWFKKRTGARTFWIVQTITYGEQHSAKLP